MTTVTVTAGHIAKGKRDDCDLCPVALAVRDAFPGFAEIAVGTDEIAIDRSGGGDWTRVATPREVLEFIRDFDRGDPVEPFTFDLDYPEVTP